MKRIIAFLLLPFVILCGCSFLSPFDRDGSDISEYKQLTTKDSEVKPDIYPENDKFKTVGFFERTQFGNLTDKQKSIYITLDNAAYQMLTGYINVGECSLRDLSVAYYAMRRDRPEYFWLPTAYSLKTVGEVRQVRFAETEDDWLCNHDERMEAETEIRAALSEYLEGLEGNETEYERELKAHDWLCEITEYDSEALKLSSGEHLAWTVYGAFIDGKAVCEGYSKAMQLLCFMQGINCGVVTGVTTSAHMWNYVKIDTGWYHLDVTSNDVSDKGYHAFFNVTTDYISESYTIDPEVFDISDDDLKSGQFNFYVPNCYKTDYNYFVQKGTYITNLEQAESTVISEVCRAVQEGETFVEFCLDPELGFVYGRDEIGDAVDLEKCIKSANADLPKAKRLKAYNYSGINGALSFMISW